MELPAAMGTIVDQDRLPLRIVPDEPRPLLRLSAAANLSTTTTRQGFFNPNLDVLTIHTGSAKIISMNDDMKTSSHRPAIFTMIQGKAAHG